VIAPAPGLGNISRKFAVRSFGMGRYLRIAALLGAGLMAACTPQVTPQQISELKPGTTTYAQIIEAFGLPSYEMNTAGGSKFLLYNRPQYERSAGQMIPFVNLFATDYDPQVYDFFIVNREGVLQSFSIPGFARETGVESPAS
jgi:hypothetical protein